jgi:hypothetical protein
VYAALRSRGGWRPTVLINAPIGLAAALLAPRFLAESESHPGEGLVGVGYRITRVTRVSQEGWGGTWTLASLGAGSPCWSRSASSPGSSPGSARWWRLPACPASPGCRVLTTVTAISMEGAANAFLVGCLMMLTASAVVWAFLDVKHTELATDGPEGVHVG